MDESSWGRSEFITLVSTYTVDRVPLPGGGVREVPGGPATYAAHALDRLNCPHRIVTGQVAQVDVLLDEEGEQYVIPALEPIVMPERLEGSAAILSPIMREIDPATVPPVDGILALDLQGFVREPLKPSGAAGKPVDLTGLLRRATVVKASKDELSRLTEESIRALDDTLVLETLGERGAILHGGGRETLVPACPIKAPYTIGAGDNFLAAFVCHMMRGHNPLSACEAAARFTESFLRTLSPPFTTS